MILFVFDAASRLTKEDEDLMGRIKGHNVVIALNKCDLDFSIDEGRIKKQYTSSKILKISATKRLGIEALEQTIVEHVWHDTRVDTHGLLVSNVRHIRALSQAQTTLARANTSLAEGLSLEFVSEEIKAAVNCLDHITGRNIDADLLDTIFSQFCIGK